MSNYYNHYCQNPDKKLNRVHINPNFNRSDMIISSSNMYINPTFSHDSPNLYHHDVKEQPASKGRIHINPNFIRNSNMFNTVVPSNTKQAISIPSSSMNYSPSQQKDFKELNQATSIHVTKSRYCLVRQKENLETKSPNLKLATNNTVRINKYKSVSLNVVKHNLATENTPKSTLDSSNRQKEKYRAGCKTSIAPTNNTRFRFVKSNNDQASSHTQLKNVSLRRYPLIKKNKIAPQKINKLALKKNNIPCPLFKKYGACLRKNRGNCVYLHDKKHVSICRKFLKGICHNEDCLLSHDLTEKKMPTCYFYLQGACTKDCCPYLHVKLNEKTKICQDFVKGYCEKGDSCLFRHINVCNKTSKKNCSKNDSTLSPAYSVINVRSRMEWPLERQEQNSYLNKFENHPVEEQRYFKESMEGLCSDEKWDKIKPSKIKLGILPSYIQL